VNITLILLAAGNSTRMGMRVKKQWLRTGHEPLWLYVANKFKTKFKNIIIVSNADDLEYMRSFDESFTYVAGGSERQISLKNALSLVKTEFVLVSDVARVEVPLSLVDELIKVKDEFDCVSPYLSVVDTTYLGENIINRDDIKLIQTPQLSKTALLKKALESDEIFTDDSMAVKSVGGKLGFIKGDKKAFKVTKKEDLARLSLPAPSTDIFVGNGFDVHKFDEGDGLMICGIKVPCEYKFIAHSDGDVALHALTDSILGACGLGDIGELFPDTDESYKGADSARLLETTLQRVLSYGYEVVNADITIIAQAPKLMNYKKLMQKRVSEILGTNRVNVKASTTERLGFVGRKEGIAVIATATLKYYDWTKF